MNVAFIGSESSGHGTYPARVTKEGSEDVLVNDEGIHRVTDGWGSHTNTSEPYDSHEGVTAEGSGSVFANGLPVARVGDPISCGGSIVTGSGNVLAGG